MTDPEASEARIEALLKEAVITAAYAEQCTRVYTRTGKKAHLLPPLASPNTHGTALCGTGPTWFETWRGTGSQDETEIVASLPLCRYCVKHAAVQDEADRRIAGLGQRERAS